MRVFWIVLSLALCCVAARADSDFLQGTGGTLYPLRGKNRDVRLVRERVNAVIYSDRCETTATYEFHNGGAAQTVPMTFPESDNFKFKRYSAFEATVDGRRLSTRRQILAATEMEEETARRVMRVHFARGQRRTVRVHYRSGYEGLGHPGDFEYGFNGGGWRGALQESSVTLTFAAPGTILTQPYLTRRDFAEKSDAVAMRRSAQDLIFRRTNWQADQWRLIVVLEPTFTPNWLDYNGADPLSHTISVPGKGRGISSAVFWLPIALLRNGMTYVSLDELDRRLSKRKIWEDRSAALDWKENSRHAVWRAGKHVLGFEAGQKTMLVDGRAVQLPVAPFIENGFGHDSGDYAFFYVPLRSVLQVLGGTVNVNARAHRLFFTGSLFPKPAKDD